MRDTRETTDMIQYCRDKVETEIELKRVSFLIVFGCWFMPS
jgi:hypothetical protein